MSEAFTREYFDTLASDPAVQNKSAKAFLATEQRIPGLGNGVLQDMLYTAGINPKTKMEKLTAAEKGRIYDSVVSVMKEIHESGGRNSESDLFCRSGGYVPYLSKDTTGSECTRCGSVIIKENYMGGSIYYCLGCQPLRK
jgi:formamidopyrimidine-DNA glycosylase